MRISGLITSGTAIGPKCVTKESTKLRWENARSTLGPLIKMLGIELETRGDLDLLAEQLISGFGLLR